MTWWKVDPWKLCVGTSHKVGESSLRDALTAEFREPSYILPYDYLGTPAPDASTFHILAFGEAMAEEPSWDHIWFIRDPWERFMSLWFHQYTDHSGGRITPDKLLELIKENTIRRADDPEPHEAPQSWHKGPRPARLLALTEMSGWWPGTREMVVRHDMRDRWRWIPWTGSHGLKKKVLEFYAEDVELWEQVQEGK